MFWIIRCFINLDNFCKGFTLWLNDNLHYQVRFLQMIGQTKLRSPFQFVYKFLQYFRILSYSILIINILIRVLKLIFYTRLVNPLPLWRVSFLAGRKQIIFCPAGYKSFSPRREENSNYCPAGKKQPNNASLTWHKNPVFLPSVGLINFIHFSVLVKTECNCQLTIVILGMEV